MPYSRPTALLAGFHADHPAPDVPEIHHIGEQWVPRVFSIPRHTHPVWEFYVQLSGETSWESRSGVFLLKPGHFFAVPPGISHRLVAPTPAKHHFYFAAVDLEPVLGRMREIAQLWRRTEIVHVPGGDPLIRAFQHLIGEVVTGLPYRATGLRLALDLLIVEASRLVDASGEQTAYLPTHPAVAQARALLEDHPDRAWRLHDLARMTGVSGNYLLELFSRHVGMPPRQFLLQARVKRAREMLTSSDAPVTTIALELGFASSQHFAATFRRLTGQSAREYRAAAHQRGTGTDSKSS